VENVPDIGWLEPNTKNVVVVRFNVI